ncbi:uncharacterized protein THITE_2117218 [Thermothielavioides terrestris NRRL 8126]|uniref:DNA replication regulator SLD2 n=2 Tax=Thermothielavioides terrestris TaxID=2587410 RepID=G2R7S1_THETT|nr:uncharacterized protein THITE_2117218 [Thermothielavioides terrestris NRRL 8126]AEO67980.1 hypothetical protein THITE_2117218 [Thermothielavioides terrestris NRRL 8126]
MPPPGSTEISRGSTHGNSRRLEQSRKRAHPEAQAEAHAHPRTPSKRPRPAHTGTTSAITAAPALTPSLDRTASTPVAAVPTSISPTPQKDGRVLGLFDLLAGTPSRSATIPDGLAAAVAATTPSASAATPSKRRSTADPLPPTLAAAVTPTTARFASTPRTKRTAQLLFPKSGAAAQATATPLQERRDKGNANAAFKTPTTTRVSSETKLGFTPTSSTPSFLRRRTVGYTATVAGLSRVDEHGADKNAAGEDEAGDGEDSWKSVGPLRLPRKLVGLGRSLSSVVAGLRKMEEEAFNDEEEVLREMERETGIGRTERVIGRKEAVQEAVEVADSQRHLGGAPRESDILEKQPVALLSGFDDEALADGVDGDNNPTQEPPLRKFKKRGPKRTTRLVNMRPTRTKRPAQATGEEEEDEDEDEFVPETQFNASKPAPLPTTATDETADDDLRLSDPDSASLSDPDFSGSESEHEERQRRQYRSKGDQATTLVTRPKQQTGPSDKSNNNSNKKQPSEAAGSGPGIVKRAARKVKATAHANFRRLKLRNSGAKGGQGQGGRWRRRR